VDDAVKMELCYILPNLEKIWIYMRILFVDLSSAFNTIVPNLHLSKLTQLICQGITNVLTDR